MTEPSGRSSTSVGIASTPKQDASIAARAASVTQARPRHARTCLLVVSRTLIERDRHDLEPMAARADRAVRISHERHRGLARWAPARREEEPDHLGVFDGGDACGAAEANELGLRLSQWHVVRRQYALADGSTGDLDHAIGGGSFLRGSGSSGALGRLRLIFRGRHQLRDIATTNPPVDAKQRNEARSTEIRGGLTQHKRWRRRRFGLRRAPYVAWLEGGNRLAYVGEVCRRERELRRVFSPTAASASSSPSFFSTTFSSSFSSSSSSSPLRSLPSASPAPLRCASGGGVAPRGDAPSFAALYASWRHARPSTARSALETWRTKFKSCAAIASI